MHGIWTTDDIRIAEERLLARTPEGALMRRAAFGVAVRAAAMLTDHVGRVSGTRVVLLVGAGNNGGDALWAGAFLRRRNVAVTAVLLAPDRAHAAGLAAFRRAGGRVADDGLAAVRSADLVVDGIVGLSAHGPLRPAAAELVAAVTAPVLAVDLPSGVDPDTGAVSGPAVGATVTVTFGARKPCHVLSSGAVHSGQVVVVDIGLLPELGEPDLVALTAADVGALWPVPGPSDNKYSQGVTGVATGSASYPGAAILSSGAATMATSGMVRFAGSAADAVVAHWPEIVATGSVNDAGRVQSWVVGPGIGTGSAAKDLLRTVLSAEVPVCVDADAITLLAGDPGLWDAREPGTPLVLTPHAGEFARLAGDVGDDVVAAARRAAKETDAVVLLKGYTTVVAAPDGRVLVNPARSAWPATAGSGDVLSGIIGALLATGLPAAEAAAAGAHLHGRTGQLAAARGPLISGDLVRRLPDAIARVHGVPAGGLGDSSV
jgi:hydroxyethylthiazole kinase-like uncharacterized protein yjeF